MRIFNVRVHINTDWTNKPLDTGLPTSACQLVVVYILKMKANNLIKKSTRSTGSIVICFIFVFIVTLSGNLVVRELRHRSSLLPANGKILSAEVGSETATFDNPTTGATTSIVYFPNIRYDYEVNGKKYNGDRYGITKRNYGSIRKVEKLLAGYRAGNIVTVWHSADEPTFAVLDKSISAHAWIVLFISGSLLITVLYWEARHFLRTRES